MLCYYFKYFSVSFALSSFWVSKYTSDHFICYCYLCFVPLPVIYNGQFLLLCLQICIPLPQQLKSSSKIFISGILFSVIKFPFGPLSFFSTSLLELSICILSSFMRIIVTARIPVLLVPTSGGWYELNLFSGFTFKSVC